MGINTTLVVIAAGLATLFACEKDPRSEESKPAVERAPDPRPAKPAVSAVAIAPKLPTPEVTVEPTPPISDPPPAPVTRAPTGPLPEPPSVVPKAYAAWLRAQPREQQARIAKFCRKHRQDFQTTCGGIGPLHIPYPPGIRAIEIPDTDPRQSLFESYEAWRGSLSGPQLAYVQRECPGGEDSPSSDLCGDNTPLVVAFDGQPIEYTRGSTFTFQTDAATATDWPTARTPWIALDRNGDGVIDHGGELFGSDTLLPGGATAANGFLALAALDDNHDGVIDARDVAFASLVLWADRDANGRSSAGELLPLSSVIVSISLASSVEPRCDARDNCEGERAALTWRDAEGARHRGSVVDVYLPRR